MNVESLGNVSLEEILLSTRQILINSTKKYVSYLKEKSELSNTKMIFFEVYTYFIAHFLILLNENNISGSLRSTFLARLTDYLLQKYKRLAIDKDVWPFIKNRLDVYLSQDSINDNQYRYFCYLQMLKKSYDKKLSQWKPGIDRVDLNVTSNYFIGIIVQELDKAILLPFLKAMNLMITQTDLKRFLT